MPVRNNGPGGYSRVSTTRKSKIEPEYPQWAESKMRAIENRRLKELQAVVRDSMPEILAIAADEMDTASESIRKMDTATWCAASRTGSALCVIGSVGG